MDITIRKNENCVIGLPRCDYVFSSTRSCFIAYGFDESNLEMSLLCKLLQERGIQPVEAAGSLAPGQSAYCAKICSKIITAQFCIVLLNNTEKASDIEIPNANVNMEYGLMLGFNKYVIPFQRASHKLPFNVAGLDTIKYGRTDFERLASDAIDQAIKSTTQPSTAQMPVDQLLDAFLMAKRALVAPLVDQGERNIYELGRPLGFNLLNDFSGMTIMFFGNFTSLRPETVIWRVRTLESIIGERLGSVNHRVKAGMVEADKANLALKIFAKLQFWILVTSSHDKKAVLSGLETIHPTHLIDVFSTEDVSSELKVSGFGAA